MVGDVSQDIHIYFLDVRYTYLDVTGKTRRLSVLPVLFLILVAELYQYQLPSSIGCYYHIILYTY